MTITGQITGLNLLGIVSDRSDNTGLEVRWQAIKLWGQVQFRSDTESDRTTSDQSIKKGADNPMDVLSCLLDNKVVGLRILTSKDPGLVRRILKDYILKDQTGKSGKVWDILCSVRTVRGGLAQTVWVGVRGLSLGKLRRVGMNAKK